ncbi:nascent polypeptide-associated complex subunit alpha-like protein 2 [Tanacetum coccineum]
MLEVDKGKRTLNNNNDDVLPDGDDKSGGKQSRSEKKSHKAMFKLGMKAILGVSRVTIKRTKNDGQILSFCSIGGVVVGIQLM